MIAHGEKLLSAAPDGQLAVAVPERCGGMRFDVALMHRLRVELALHNDIRFREALLHIAVVKDKVVGDIGLLVAVAVAARAECGTCHREQTLVQDGRVVSHRVIGG